MGSIRVSRRLAICALLLFAAMGLCPPWVYTFSPPGATTTVRPAGYHPLFAPPSPERGEISGVRIDIGRLMIQWAILGAITGAFAIRRAGRHSVEGGDPVLDTPVKDEKTS